jgi:hypothetical protein
LGSTDNVGAKLRRGTAACVEKGLCDQWSRGSAVDDYCSSGAGRGGVVVQVAFLRRLLLLEADFLLVSDPDGLLELSAEQKEAGVVWRRPSEVLASAKILSSDLRPEDIAQRVVADCSLCASVVVSLLHSRSHNSSVRLLFLLYPLLLILFLDCLALPLPPGSRWKPVSIADRQI